jgi:hypothetical protein
MTDACSRSTNSSNLQCVSYLLLRRTIKHDQGSAMSHPLIGRSVRGFTSTGDSGQRDAWALLA